MRLYIICTATVISLISPAFAGSTALIHGAVYKWDTFEPLDNAVVEVNSTPIQYMVAKNGIYSFDSKEPIYGSKVNIFSENLNKSGKNPSQNAKNSIPETAIYKINDSKGLDITGQPLEPATENLKPRDRSQIWPKIASILLFSDLTNDLGTSPTKQSKFYSSIIFYLLIVLTCFVLVVGNCKLFKRSKHLEEDVSEKGKNGYITKYILEFLSAPGFLV